MRALRIGLTAVLPLAGALLLVACGGHSSGPNVASAGGTGATHHSSASPTPSMDRQAQLLAYAQCMRQHGIDMPDPDLNSGGIQLSLPQGVGKDDPTLVAAQNACKQYLPNGGAPPSMSPEQIEQMRQYAQCMRDHGIQMADPDPNTGGITIRGGSGASPGDKTQTLNDPAFKAAQEACQDKLPNKLNGGGGK
jgi:hypothetical protein